MKRLYVLITALFIFFILVGQSAYASIKKEIRSNNNEFRNVVELDIQQYEEAIIKNVYLEHRQKTKKSGTQDYLYVKGSFKNLQKTILAGAKIQARFYDANGNLLNIKQGAVIPRIMRQYRKNRGHFTLKVPYDSEISVCKLDAVWSGKEGLY